jgi:hypothetical protein
MRLGLGVSYMGAKLDTEPTALHASAAGYALEFALGGTVADGLVIGGGAYAAGTSTIKWKADNLGSGSVSGGPASMSVLGVFADYYPNPKDGFHVQGALGIGGMSFARDSDSGIPLENWSGGVGGAMLGVGYEFWVGRQWSIGAVGRVLLVSGTLRGQDSDVDFSAKSYAPSLLFAATNH